MQIINELVSIPSPSNIPIGSLATWQITWTSGIESRRNRKGALIVTVPGKNDTVHRLLTAHIDTLGAMVKEIKANGGLRLTNIGGTRWAHVEGEYCKIFTSDGNTYTGTILMRQTSVHVYKGQAPRSAAENMEVRIDARVQNAEDVAKLGIKVGDFVAFDPRVEVLPSGFIKSRHLDDKASAGILLYRCRK